MTGNKPGGQVLVAGSANVDLVVRAPHIPAPGETVLGGDLLFAPGGKGANQAVACARAGGAATTMLLALGNDSFAAMLEQSLREADVTAAIVRTDRSTGAALITVSHEAENAITVAPGANLDLHADDLPNLSGTDWLVMQLETPINTVTAFAQKARSAGVKVLLNAAPAQPLSAELLGNVDVLVVNEAELTAIVGGHGSIADRLRATGISCAVVTLGARGCCALSDGEFLIQPADLVTPVDTTAAGDTFVGVLAAALFEDRPMTEALRTASAAAALTTTRAGAQMSIPDAAEVNRQIADGIVKDASDLAKYCGISAPNP